MAVALPNGAIVSIASAYGVSKAMTAVTNANPGVATLETGHGIVVNDVFVLTSGWSRLNSRVARASAVTGNDISIEGINTTSTTLYPAAAGAGTIKEVTGFTQISQILEFTTNGGDQQFVTYSFLEEDTERQIPTVKSPQSFSLTIGDDATLAHYAILDAADADRTPRVLKVLLANGSVLYYNAYVTLNRTPTLTKNEVMGLRATFSLVSDPTRYVS